MTQIELCPRCKQPLPPQLRAGVYLPAKKAAIFDTIHKHPGITADGILANCFFDEKASVKRVRVHICQINDMLAGTDLRIRGEKFGGKENGGYRIVKVPA
ncbi:hypothetical protein [Bradyrhizobium sp. USDA 10063]